MANSVPPNAKPLSDAEAAPAPRGRRPFPNPLTILAGVLFLVWLAAFFIPPGEFQLDAAGSPIPGTYREVPSPLTSGERLRELFLAPVNGLFGIQNLDTGFVSPFNTGRMFGSVEVFFFILTIGSFMTAVFRTGSLDRGIHTLAYQFRTQGAVLIVALSILFGLLGTTMSWSDETLGMYALIVPLMVALRYDRMVAVAVITVAPFVGRLGSTINPFTIGVGSAKADISIGDGIGLRVVLFVLVMAATIFYVMRYSKRVQADPAMSISGIGAEDQALAEADSGRPPALSGRDKMILALTAFTFALLTFSIIPWGGLLSNTAVDPYTHQSIVSAFPWELGWWLPELSAMFLVMALVVGVVGGLGEQGTAKAIIQGAVDFTGPAFLVVFARGISVIMTNTQTIDTVLFWMEGLVSGLSSIGFVLVMFLVSLPLSFLVGGGAAGTALVMPVFAPLGDFAGVDRSLVLLAWSTAGGWLGLVLPTNAILVAGLALGKVGFDQYFRFILPLMGILLLIVMATLIVGTFI